MTERTCSSGGGRMPARCSARCSEAAALPDDAEPDRRSRSWSWSSCASTPRRSRPGCARLAAIRLVLATRLGIRSEEDHDVDDPRFGIYDWLGYRLDGLVQAASTTTTERASGDREDVRGATWPARRARDGAPPAPPSASQCGR